jgi:hypothetical protein
VAREKILIAVKTYPTISGKYTELACTAGFREDGSWIRLYPIPFRLLEHNKRYKKYQWIEVDIARNPGDPRPESYRVVNTDGISLLNEMKPGREWEERRRLILGNNKIHKNLKELIGLAHQNKVSLAVFKPAEVMEFVAEECDPDWPQDKLDAILDKMKQGHLFDDQNLEEFRIMPKLPYKFFYRFKDEVDVESRLVIEDWEIGQLYWNCLKRYGNDQAVEKVRQKYMDDFVKTKDLYLFLGTTCEWHVRKAKNPFVIIGTFHPAHVTQPTFI